MLFQLPESLENVAVFMSPEEWGHRDPSKSAFSRDLVQENCKVVNSLGKDSSLSFSFFHSFLLSFCLKCRETGKDTSSVDWFFPWMDASSRPGPCQRQESGAPSGLQRWGQALRVSGCLDLSFSFLAVV